MFSCENLRVRKNTKLRKGTACISLEKCKRFYNNKKDTGLLVVNKWFCNFSLVKKIN